MLIFKDRREAGQKLAKKLKKFKEQKPIILAIPNGGVPVGVEIARELEAPLDVMVVRKIQLPWSTEAGFGACSPDGCFILNQEMVQEFGLEKNVIERQKEKTMLRIIERLKKYRGDKPFPAIKNKTVILVDDGLASGYTMVAACRYLRPKQPKEIVVAVPCASAAAIERVRQEADEVISLAVKSDYPFAVADFYDNWYDLSDDEVIRILKGQ